MTGAGNSNGQRGDAIIRFDDVSLHFDDVPALVHVSFELRAGQTLVIVGAAGSGKTVLLKCAVGLERGFCFRRVVCSIRSRLRKTLHIHF